MPQPNRLKPSTSAFTMLRREWTLVSPDNCFGISAYDGKLIVLKKHTDARRSASLAGEFPLTSDGFQQMMDEVINPPF